MALTLQKIVDAIDAEIARLQRVRDSLLGLGKYSKRPRPRMSAKARARISRVQKARWAKFRAKKKARQAKLT